MSTGFSDKIGTRLVYSDERVRIWLLDLDPGEESGFHQHTCDYVYVVLTGGCTETLFADGRRTAAADAVGDAVYHQAGQPHSLRNRGDVRYSNVIVELLDRPRPDGPGITVEGT